MVEWVGGVQWAHLSASSPLLQQAAQREGGGGWRSAWAAGEAQRPVDEKERAEELQAIHSNRSENPGGETKGSGLARCVLCACTAHLSLW